MAETFEEGDRVGLYRKLELLATGTVVAYTDRPSDCVFSHKGTERIRVELTAVADRRLDDCRLLALTRDYDRHCRLGPARPGGWSFVSRRLARGRFKKLSDGRYRPVERPIGTVEIRPH